jgi:hypothetical protein
MTIYLCGDTIRITASFNTFSGVLADLTTGPTAKLYDGDKITVLVTGTVVHDSTGVYHTDITLPTTEGTRYIEFAGVSETKPIVAREELNVRFSLMS